MCKKKMDEDPLFSPNNNIKKPPQQEVFDDDDDDDGDESDDYDNDDDDDNDDDSSENPAPCLMQSSFLVPKINLGTPNPGSTCKDSLGATIKYGLISTPGNPPQKKQELFYINKPLNPMAKEFRPANNGQFSLADYSFIASKPAVICPTAFKPRPPPPSADVKLLSHITEILKDNRLLVLMRGCPGSGKSTLAGKILSCLEKGKHGVVLSTDNYFNQKNSHYDYDSAKLSKAHEWNKNKARAAMAENVKIIIIDNTNITKWEMSPYAKLAFQYNYKVEIVEPNTSWRFNARKLEAHNIHDVSMSKIKDMLTRYERNVTVEQLIPAKKSQGENCHTSGNTGKPQRKANHRRRRRGDRARHTSNDKDKTNSDNNSSPEMPQSEAFLANDKPIKYPPTVDDIYKDITFSNIGHEWSDSGSWGSDQWLEPQAQRTPKQKALNETPNEYYYSSSSGCDPFEEEVIDILNSIHKKKPTVQGLASLTLNCIEKFGNEDFIKKASLAAVEGFERKNVLLLENFEKTIKPFGQGFAYLVNDGDDISSSIVSSTESLKDSTSSASEESTDVPVEDQLEFYVKFSLEYNFAHLLMQLFGPINILTNNEPDHKGNINLKVSYADMEHLHQTLSSICALKKGIDSCEKTKKKKAKTSKVQSGSQNQNLPAPVPPPPTAVSLAEIMKEQEESMIELNKKIEKNDHITAGKLKKLCSEFPGYDPNVIEDIFKSNDYHLHETMAILQGHPQRSVIDWRFDSKVDPVPSSTGKKVKKPNVHLHLNWLKTVKENQFEVVEFYEARLKDSIHQRNFYCASRFNQAASYYREKVYEFKTKFKTAKLNLLKQNIASLLAADNYNQIDMHGMNRQEVAYILRECLKDYTKAIENSSSMKHHLIFITGKGMNSKNRMPVLKPFIVNFLETNKYQFTASEGQVKVFF